MSNALSHTNNFHSIYNEIEDLLNKAMTFIKIYTLPNSDKIEVANIDIEVRKNLETILVSKNLVLYLDIKNNEADLLNNLNKFKNKLTIFINNISSSLQKKYVDYLEIMGKFNLYLEETIAKIENLDTYYSKIASLLENTEKLNKEAIIYKEKILTEKTEAIYQTKSTTYLKYANKYDNNFYYLIAIIIIVSLLTLCLYSKGFVTFEVFLYFKILIVTISITIATLFLRKASHYRKLHHTYEHIHLELTALPIYLYNIPEEQHAEIYKNLINTYFGNHIDSSHIDKSGDLINEQIKNSIELMKVSADITKATKESQVK